MIKPTKQVIKLSNLINDCVVMIQEAGQLVQKTNMKSSAFTRSSAINRKESIADVDFLIRQTYMHNLS